ncbi:hypothetical protein KJ848_00655 [Patescibacteria group bacterium]|nr:hypothetical protein [Patescibacteria group bacterium]MBU2158683.1 hypothetical protein [Patescibacteria group bacterium]
MPDLITQCTGDPLEIRAHWEQCKICIPQIHLLCAPLLGNSKLNEDGSRSTVRLSLSARITCFRKALESVIVKRDSGELMTLAGHRRMVTELGGIPPDRLLYNLANELGIDWQNFACRMPDKSLIAKAAFRRAGGRGTPRELVSCGWQRARR